MHGQFIKKQSPDRPKFFSSLKDEFISKKIIHMLIMFGIGLKWRQWSLFKTYVLLLADFFEKFISTCLEYYGLDPCHYFISPSYWKRN